MTPETLAQENIHIFNEHYGIKNEQGLKLDFKDHSFLWEPYQDLHPKQAILKAAQIGFTTLAINKTLWLARNKKMDIIYVLPTAEDVTQFAGGKVNRIVANNDIFKQYTKDKDSVEQKQVGENIIYYRGSWTTKAAIMVSSDLNVYDEIDSCKQEVIEQYATRLQHSNYRWEWYFSHPSTEGFGVDKYWQKSDQKHWFIKCGACNMEQYLSFPESIDQDKEIFICKECKAEITDDMRRKGRWVAKYKDREFRGYWIPSLIVPKISAKQILGYYKDKTEEYFYNKVLGLPYVGGGNKLTWALFSQNLTDTVITPDTDERIVIGVDTGLKLDYVIGGQQGLFFHGEAKDYDELDALMKRWKRAIAVVDGGGDLIGSRKFQERWKGRVYLGFFRGDRKTQELVTWGENDNYGTLQIDRDRIIQLVVDEFRERRIPVQGDEGDWQDYWSDWNNLTRIKILDPLTGQHKGFKWVRNGRDHRALATTLWRSGMMRFGGVGSVVGMKPKITAESGTTIEPDGTFKANLDEYFRKRDNSDWRL